MNRTAISGILLSFLLVLAPLILLASDSQPSGEGNLIDTPEEINDYIVHHLQDSHDFTLYTDGETGHHIGFPLPVILWDDGLKVFSSSRFHHGETVAEVDGNYYSLYHSKIYKTNANGDLDLDEAGHSHNARPLDFSITKSVLGMLIAGILLVWGFGSLAKSYKKGPLPTGLGRVLEPLVIYVRDDIAKPNIGEKKHRKFMGFLLTAFFYIWVLNLMGMTPLGFNVTGQIAVTVCLAAFTFFITQFIHLKNIIIFWIDISLKTEFNLRIAYSTIHNLQLVAQTFIKCVTGSIGTELPVAAAVEAVGSLSPANPVAAVVVAVVVAGLLPNRLLPAPNAAISVQSFMLPGTE